MIKSEYARIGSMKELGIRQSGDFVWEYDYSVAHLNIILTKMRLDPGSCFRYITFKGIISGIPDLDRRKHALEQLDAIHFNALLLTNRPNIKKCSFHSK